MISQERKYPYGILIDSESLKTGLQNGTRFDLVKGELCKNVRADCYLIAKKKESLTAEVDPLSKLSYF
jgi:hypothetical protein